MDNIIWKCRFHPTDWFHEVGCPHVEWTKEDLQKALETKKRFVEQQSEAGSPEPKCNKALPAGEFCTLAEGHTGAHVDEKFGRPIFFTSSRRKKERK